jgi:hypothetical protein
MRRWKWVGLGDEEVQVLSAHSMIFALLVACWLKLSSNSVANEAPQNPNAKDPKQEEVLS